MSNTIPYISYSDIHNKKFIEESLYPDIDITYYWSDDFSPSLYVELAKKGLISTSRNYEEVGDILLPEMQESYAVLDFENLHIGKKVKKLFNKSFDFKTGLDLELVLPLINKYHGNESWLTPTYLELLYKLKKHNIKNNNFELMTTVLYSEDRVTSGEIGYLIGNTYTSLTGFYNKEFNNWGTFQLVLLSNYLESRGISFWNMGHPYMEYKKRLGATILKREDFLLRWLKSTHV